MPPISLPTLVTNLPYKVDEGKSECNFLAFSAWWGAEAYRAVQPAMQQTLGSVIHLNHLTAVPDPKSATEGGALWRWEGDSVQEHPCAATEPDSNLISTVALCTGTLLLLVVLCSRRAPRTTTGIVPIAQ